MLAGMFQVLLYAVKEPLGSQFTAINDVSQNFQQLSSSRCLPLNRQHGQIFSGRARRAPWPSPHHEGCLGAYRQGLRRTSPAATGCSWFPALGSQTLTPLEKVRHSFGHASTSRQNAKYCEPKIVMSPSSKLEMSPRTRHPAGPWVGKAAVNCLLGLARRATRCPAVAHCGGLRFASTSLGFAA